MVYCGRPSTSCSNCRAKKRRCDKAVPGCGQCRRMEQTCPGYRDPSSLVFRDESSQVIDRARSRVSKKSNSSHPRPPPVDGARSLAAAEVMLGGEQDNLFADNGFPSDFFNFQNAFGEGSGLLSPNDGSSSSILDAGSSMTSPWTGVEAGDGGEAATQSHQDMGSDINKGDKQYGLDGLDGSPNDIARPFSLPLDTIGLNFFLSHYVVRQSSPSSGFLDYTLDVLSREEGHDMLESAILALAFTGLARTTQQQDLMCRSMMMYTRTMDQVNRALADPQASRRDSTIVTVLVLALYEFGKSSLDGWKHHVQSAASLLALRGKTQLATPVGLQIFKDVFSQLLMNCVRAGCPIPSNLRMLRIEAAKKMGVSDPYWVSCSAAVELLDLYQHFSPGGYTFTNNTASSPSSSSQSELAKSSSIPIEDLELYLSQALEIDHRLESQFSECSQEWQFVTMKGSSFQGGTYHIYHDVWVAHVWNRMRTCRVLANHAISHLLLRGATIDRSWFFSNQYADRLQQLTKNMTQIREDMIASIPQQMGLVSSPAQQQQLLEGMTPVNFAAEIKTADTLSISPSSYSPASSFRPDQFTYTGSAAGGYFASWVLVGIGCMHNLDDETRAWTVAQLRRVSSQTGLAMADDFADSVESYQLRPPLT